MPARLIVSTFFAAYALPHAAGNPGTRALTGAGIGAGCRRGRRCADRWQSRRWRRDRWRGWCGDGCCHHTRPVENNQEKHAMRITTLALSLAGLLGPRGLCQQPLRSEPACSGRRADGRRGRRRHRCHRRWRTRRADRCPGRRCSWRRGGCGNHACAAARLATTSSRGNPPPPPGLLPAAAGLSATAAAAWI